MYYSGRWRGYWEQPGFGRQWMQSLDLEFQDGLIKGRGRDIVGPFTFSGTYESDGIIKMVKQYIGQHVVFYTGAYDGEGSIFGRWAIAPGFEGPFVLQPDLKPDQTSSLPIQDL